MRLHFREYGQGVPLIILHGLFGSLANWDTISRRLAEKFHVFAIDQRNHGRSPHSGEMNYPAMAKDLVEFFQEHSISGGHVLGHSMGGKAAMQLALSFPERVLTLIVVDMAPRMYPAVHRDILDALSGLRLELLQTREDAENALAASIPNLAARRFLLKNLARNKQDTFHWRLNLDGIRRNQAQLSAAVEAGKPCNQPALFIRGGRSDYVQDQDITEIRRLFPGAEFRTITDADHWVHTAAPELFVETVEHFLLARNKPAALREQC